MHLLSSDKITARCENIIHEETQLHEKRIDLTVDEIYKFTKAGSLDFGGSEFKAAKTETVNPRKQNEDDDYGWWKLERGRYKCLLNESISSEGTLAVLTLHEHAKEAGLTANTNLVLQKTNRLSLSFDVPEAGCDIKENARIATAFLIKIE